MTSVSSKQKFFSHNNIDKLRMKLYDIACHLQLSSDGVTCEPGFTVDQSWPVYMYMYNVQNVHVRIYSEYKLKITLLTSCYFPSPAPSPSLFPPSFPSSLPPPLSLFSVEYKEGCKEDDPKCLFQQQIPKNFLQLQEEIREVVAGYRVSGRIPILEEGEFR